MRALLVLVFVSLGSCGPTGDDENDFIKNTCGAELLQTQSKWKNKYKSYGGRRLLLNEYPWVARLYVHGQYECSGALISPIHVLTAAHCVHAFTISEREERCRRRPHSRYLPPLRKASSFEVYLGNSCGTASGCQKAYQVERVMSDLTDICGPEDDIAILELDEIVSSNEAVPICLPSEHQQLVDPLQSAGAGRNENRTFGYLQTLKYIHHREGWNLVTVFSNSSSVCDGDSGGPLFQRGPDGRYTAVGVLSTGDGRKLPANAYSPCEIKDVKEIRTVWINHFVDVRRYISWICEKTENGKFGFLQTLKYIRHKEDGKLVTVFSNSSSVCEGDSGGPLFQRGPDGRYTAVGVLSTDDGRKLPDKAYSPCQIKNAKKIRTSTHLLYTSLRADCS